MCLSSEEIGVPDTEKTTNDGDVLLKGSLLEVLVHCVGTRKELVEVVEANVECYAQADGAPDAVTSANPAFEAKHVLLVNTEFGHFLHVGGQGDEVLCDVALLFC